MFKDVFILKKTSWHVKMMKYIWNLDYYDFSHMCPYWWLTVFNHIIFLPVFVIKTIFKGLKAFSNLIGSLFEALMDYYEQKRVESYRTLAKEVAQDPKKAANVSQKQWQQIYSILMYNDNYSEIRGYYDAREAVKAEKKHIEEQKKEEAKIERTFDELAKSINDTKAANLATLEAKSAYIREQQKIREEAERQRRIRNKQKITRILKIVKPILTYGAYILGSLLVLIALYYFCKLMVWTYGKVSAVKHSQWESLIDGLWFVCKWSFFIAIFAMIVYFIVKWLSRMTIKVPNLGVGKFFYTLGYYIIFPLVFITKRGIVPFFRAIGNGFKLIIQMIKNECPAIKWED